MRANRFRISFVVALIATTLALSGCAQLVARARAASAQQLNGAENGFVSDINAYRNAHGLPGLAVHGELVNKARGWAANMANGGCGHGAGGVANICHSALSTGVTVAWTRLEENVGMVSPRTNVAGMQGAFEHSPEHAANMLDGQIRYIGVGVAYVGDYMYVAEEFMAG